MYPPFNGAAPPSGFYYGDPEYFEKQQEKRALARRGLGIGLAIVGMQVLPYLFTTVAATILHAAGLIDPYAIDNGYSGMQPLTYYIYYALLYLLMVTVPFLVLMPCFHLRFGQVMPFRKTARPGLLVLAGAGGLAMCMAANYLATQYSAVMQSIGIPTDMSSLPKDGSLVSQICYFVILAVLPAFAEEFAFRGVTLQLLRPYGEAFAVIGSAFAFGVMHGTVIQIPFAFAGGLFFGYIAVRTGSIWPSVLLHFLNNALSYFQELIQDHSAEFVYQQTSTVLLYALFLVATVGGLLCLAVLLHKDKNFFRTNPDAAHRLSDKEKFAVYIGNPGMILALIVICISMVVQMATAGMIS